jgi:hypothetical protein
MGEITSHRTILTLQLTNNTTWSTTFLIEDTGTKYYCQMTGTAIRLATGIRQILIRLATGNRQILIRLATGTRQIINRLATGTRQIQIPLATGTRQQFLIRLATGTRQFPYLAQYPTDVWNSFSLYQNFAGHPT